MIWDTKAATMRSVVAVATTPAARADALREAAHYEALAAKDRNTNTPRTRS